MLPVFRSSILLMLSVFHSSILSRSNAGSLEFPFLLCAFTRIVCAFLRQTFFSGLVEEPYGFAVVDFRFFFSPQAGNFPATQSSVSPALFFSRMRFLT